MSGHPHPSFKAYLDSQDTYKTYTDDWRSRDEPLLIPACLSQANSSNKHPNPSLNESRHIADFKTFKDYLNSDSRTNHPATNTSLYEEDRAKFSVIPHEAYWGFQIQYFNHPSKTREFLNFLITHFEHAQTLASRIPNHPGEVEVKRASNSAIEGFKLYLEILKENPSSRPSFELLKQAANASFQWMADHEIQTSFILSQRRHELEKRLRQWIVFYNLAANLERAFCLIGCIGIIFALGRALDPSDPSILREANLFYPSARLSTPENSLLNNLCSLTNTHHLPTWFDVGHLSTLTELDIKNWPPLLALNSPYSNIGIAIPVFLSTFLHYLTDHLSGNAFFSGIASSLMSMLMPFYLNFCLEGLSSQTSSALGWAAACGPASFNILYDQVAKSSASSFIINPDWGLMAAVTTFAVSLATFFIKPLVQAHIEKDKEDLLILENQPH